MSSPTIESQDVAYDGWSRILKLVIAMPDGSKVKREVEHHGHAATLLPYDPERRMALMVRQLRAPVLLTAGHPDLLEAPAGLLDDDTPEDCARREAEEEVGLTVRELEPVGMLQAMPGISTEEIHAFLAPYREADRSSKGGGLASESETIIVEEIPLARLAGMADRGELSDMKTFALVQTLRLRRPELFRD